MEASQTVQIWKDSLLAMRNSLQSSYEIEKSVLEREECSKPNHLPDAEQVLSFGCRHNEGLKRIKQISDIIDNAVIQIDRCDSAGASNIYLRTLEAIALLSKRVKVI